MSDEYEDDISQSLAAECTGTVGLPDDTTTDDPVYDSLADAIEAYDEHAAQDAPVHDADDTQADDDVQQPARGDKKVPLGALQEERTKRQLAQDNARALEQQNAQLMAQLAQYQQQQQQLVAQQQQEALPDFDEDPRGYIEAKERQFVQQLQQVQQQQQVQQFSVQLQQERLQLAPVVAEAEATFAESVGVENYRTAFDAVHQAIQANMRQQHPYASPQEMALLEQVVNVQFVRECQARGINPAEHIYNRAIEMGLTPAVPGQRVPGTQQAPKPPTSLSTIPAGGRAPDETGKVTAKDIAKMSPEAFDKFFDSMRENGMQRPAV